MKRIKFWHPIAAVLLGLSLSVAASYPAIKIIQTERAQQQSEIIELDLALRKALIEHDIPALQNLLAEDFEIYTVNQGVLSKGEWIRNIQRNMVNYTQVKELETPQIQGNQISVLSEVSGEFWGIEAQDKPVQTTIRLVERKDKLQIKCVVIKLV
ncbi:nuclear transport factor 2 family protein [Actinobacillus minor]|uniref:nuclear transport factor 2 family protein n=1 Tax=Actinobacillus minor TaxID=51047 RepID=UPI0026F2DB4C|nr:nuclear transport factor 2 family protein [Actinobacillus minor]